MHPVIGADPYRRVFSAVALDERGGVLGRWQGSTTRQGVLNLRQWAGVCAPGAAWAIEGANSLRRSLSIALVGAGADVRDVCPTRTADRQRRLPGHGKSDAVDAEAIARELLAHPDLPWALKAATPQGLDPARDALIAGSSPPSDRGPPPSPPERGRRVVVRAPDSARRAAAGWLEGGTSPGNGGASTPDG
jgi:hypothetical protein